MHDGNEMKRNDTKQQDWLLPILYPLYEVLRRRVFLEGLDLELGEPAKKAWYLALQEVRSWTSLLFIEMLVVVI